MTLIHGRFAWNTPFYRLDLDRLIMECRTVVAIFGNRQGTVSDFESATCRERKLFVAPA